MVLRDVAVQHAHWDEGTEKLGATYTMGASTGRGGNIHNSARVRGWLLLGKGGGGCAEGQPCGKREFAVNTVYIKYPGRRDERRSSVNWGSLSSRLSPPLSASSNRNTGVCLIPLAY